MQLEKIRELILKSKAFATSRPLQDLAVDFGTFIELYQEQGIDRDDPIYLQKLTEAFTQFWASFDHAAKSLGLSPEVLKKNFNHPESFTPEEWATMQEMKREVTEERAPMPKKLKKKNNKNVRI